MKKVFIYRITNLINSKAYIGIGVSLSVRWARHKGGTGSPLLFAAFKKYGVENFSFEHIATAFTQDGAAHIERMLISEEGTITPGGYNVDAGGRCGSIGRKISEETRQRLRDSHVGKRPTREAIEKSAAANRGKKRPPEFGMKISAAKKGIKQTPEQAAITRRNIKKYAHLSKTPEAIAKWRATRATRKLERSVVHNE